jgi:transposase-like protein
MRKKTVGREEKQAQTLHSLLDARQLQEEILGRCKQAALSMGMALLEEEVAAICGPAFSRKVGERCHRGGSDQTSIIVAGAKYRIKRPRARNAQGEVQLESLEKLQTQDLLDEKIHQAMLAGVSTRNYEQVIEGYSDKLGVTKSSASRAFVRASRKDLEAINSADLGELRFVALTVDSFELYGRAMVAAMGVDVTFKKVPLGLKEGDSENAEVVKDLLSSIRDRHFTPACPYFIALLDGSKALKKAVRAVFGDAALIQRCWLHKLRNLKKYVPERLHGTLYWRMKKLMNLNTFEDALEELQSLAKWLAEVSHGAQESLEEAGVELLTLHALGVTGELRKSLTTTNMIEALIDKIRAKLHRVRNGRCNTTLALRWSAAAIKLHAKTFKRLRGSSQQAEKLVAALTNFKLDKLAA